MHRLLRPRCAWALGIALVAALYAAAARTAIAPGWDHAFYLTLARNLVEGQGYTLQGAAHIKYPPGLPLLLVPVVACTTAPWLVSLYCGALALVTAGVVAWFVRPRHGAWAAACIALVFALGWQTLRHVPEPLSELPYTAASLLAIAATDHWRASGAGAWRAGALLASAFLVRVVGLVLLPALGWVVLLRRPRPARAGTALLALLAAVPAAAWFARSAAVGATSAASVAEENLSYDRELLLDAPERRRAQPPSPLGAAAVLLERMPGNARQMVTAAADLLTGEASADAPAPAQALRTLGRVLALALLAIGWLRAWRGGSIAEPYAALYLLVLLVWPWPGLMHRFLLPLLPLLLGYVWRGARTLLPAARPARLACALGALLLAGQARSTWHAWHHVQGHDRDGQSLRAALATRDWILAHTRPDAVLQSEWAAWLHWQTRHPVRFVQIQPEPEVLADTQRADFLVLSDDDRGLLRRAVALAPERFAIVAEFGDPAGPRWWILRRDDLAPRPVR